MFIFSRVFFVICFLIILTGCIEKNAKETVIVPKKQNSNIKKEINHVQNLNVKKETKPIKNNAIKKKVVYKYCNKYIKTMNYASSYIKKEFDKGYFQRKDIVGAKAQLFLIENKSPTIFAKNINAAQESYVKQYQLAKKHKCNLKKFKITPLDKIKNKIKILEKKRNLK